MRIVAWKLNFPRACAAPSRSSRADCFPTYLPRSTSTAKLLLRQRDEIIDSDSDLRRRKIFVRAAMCARSGSLNSDKLCGQLWWLPKRACARLNMSDMRPCGKFMKILCLLCVALKHARNWIREKWRMERFVCGVRRKTWIEAARKLCHQNVAVSFAKAH